MNLQLVHTLNEHVDLLYGSRPLFRYVYRPHTDPCESLKPYLHPVNTLGGNTVTIFRPHDHLWHHGIAMTSAHLDIVDPGDEHATAENFWGGPTYVREQGYVQLDNNGRIEHLAWDGMQCDDQNAVLKESLFWIAHNNHTWLAELREISIGEINMAELYWCLDFSTTLTNIAAQKLVFGSPTTAGRPLAGYGGLFWRGPRSFLGGRILAAGGLEGPDVMGKTAPWLAFTGQHDSAAPTGAAPASTLLFLDQPGNLRYPTQWFVRNEPYGCVSFAFAFDEVYVLEPGQAFTQRYRIVIADGAWSRERIEAILHR